MKIMKFSPCTLMNAVPVQRIGCLHQTTLNQKNYTFSEGIKHNRTDQGNFIKREKFEAKDSRIMESFLISQNKQGLMRVQLKTRKNAGIIINNDRFDVGVADSTRLINANHT